MSGAPKTVTDSAYGFMLGQQIGTSNALAEWKNYARMLEDTLNQQKAQTERQAAIKEAALKEIARLDPSNPIMRQEVRKAIGDQAEKEARKKGLIS